MEKAPHEKQPGEDSQHRETMAAIYRMYVETAENVSTRRIQTNGFFLTLLTGLFVLAWSPWLPQVVEGLGRPAADARIVLFMGGFFLSILWWAQILQFRTLNRIKFQEILNMERLLPLAPFTRENDALRRSKGYIGFSRVEGFIPLVFAMGFALSIAPFHTLLGFGLLLASIIGILGMLLSTQKKE